MEDFTEDELLAAFNKECKNNVEFGDCVCLDCWVESIGMSAREYLTRKLSNQMEVEE